MWRGDGGAIEWRAGQPRRVLVQKTVVVPAERVAAVIAPSTTYRSSFETIGGRRAEVWQNRVDTEFRTGATWSDEPPMFMTGTASSLATAEIHLRIYRTIRFR